MTNVDLNTLISQKDPRVMELFGETYIRSDLSAEMVDMHKNTLLQKAKDGKIRRYRHRRAIWFKEIWLREFVEMEDV